MFSSLFHVWEAENAACIMYDNPYEDDIFMIFVSRFLLTMVELLKRDVIVIPSVIIGRRKL